MRSVARRHHKGVEEAKQRAAKVVSLPSPKKAMTRPLVAISALRQVAPCDAQRRAATPQRRRGSKAARSEGRVIAFTQEGNDTTGASAASAS
jgi:hypothetical protein